MSITGCPFIHQGNRSICKISMLSLLVLLLVGVPLARVMATGTAYHVATSGNDSNSGLSLEQAWRNIETANTRLLAGDTVWIHAGQGGMAYNDSICPHNLGSVGLPILYQTWGTETVRLNPTTNAAIQIRGNYHVWVRPTPSIPALWGPLSRAGR